MFQQLPVERCFSVEMQVRARLQLIIWNELDEKNLSQTTYIL